MDDPESIDRTRVDPRHLVMGLFGLAGLALVAYGLSAKFSLLGRACTDGCGPSHPLVVVPAIFLGLIVVGFSVGLLARAKVE